MEKLGRLGFNWRCSLVAVLCGGLFLPAFLATLFPSCRNLYGPSFLLAHCNIKHVECSAEFFSSSLSLIGALQSVCLFTHHWQWEWHSWVKSSIPQCALCWLVIICSVEQCAPQPIASGNVHPFHWLTYHRLTLFRLNRRAANRSWWRLYCLYSFYWPYATRNPGPFYCRHYCVCLPFYNCFCLVACKWFALSGDIVASSSIKRNISVWPHALIFQLCSSGHANQLAV